MKTEPDKPYIIQMKETDNYMMGFVIVTENDNAIVIDGGRSTDSENLLKTIGDRHISAWIFTHAHNDHIGAFMALYENGRFSDLDIEKIYYNFPSLELLENKNVPDYEYYSSDINEMLPAFYAIEEKIKHLLIKVEKGDSIIIDGIKFDFLYTYRSGLTSNTINDSSIVFKVYAGKTTLLFLGDLGPDGGDILFRESRDLLKADIVQMAHHGHMNVAFEVYSAISPKACLWCCPEWLYSEPIIPSYLADTEKMVRMKRQRMFGTALTREWMDTLGVKMHYVSKDGPNIIEL